jgi:hypothetical protein
MAVAAEISAARAQKAIMPGRVSETAPQGECVIEAWVQAT